MQTPTYDVNGKAETGWAAVSLAVGGLVGAILAAVNVEPAVIGAASTLAASLTRVIIGHFLPSGKQ